MGKKKAKELKITETKPIVYSGKVILKTVKNGKVTSTKVQHNNGTNALFDFLLSCLAGAYATELKPNYITPILKTNTENIYNYATNGVCTNISAFNLSLSLRDKAPYIEYNFYLSHMNDYQTTGIDGLALYCDKYAPKADTEVIKDAQIADNYSMIVLFDDNKKLAENEGLIVIWQLSVANAK